VAQAISPENIERRYIVGENDILLNPNLTPLFSLITKYPGRRTPSISTRLEWFEDDFAGVWGQVNNGTTSLASNNTNIPVLDVTIFAVGDLVAVPQVDSVSTAEEILRVTAVAGTTNGTLTVTRGIGGAGADTIGPTVDLRVVAPAYAEGASFGTPRFTSKAKKISYTQIFRQPVTVTKSMVAQGQYGTPENERMFQRRKMLEEHRRHIESAGLWGRASESLVTGAPGSIRTSMGLKSRLTTNVHDVNSTFTETSMMTFSELSFGKYYNGDKKVLLAAARVISAFDFLADNRLRLTPETTVFGVKAQMYVTSHGTFAIVRDLLLEDGPNGGIGWGDEAYAIDPDSISFHPLNGNGENRDTQLLLDVKKNGDDLYADEWLTEGGWAVRHESRHSRLFECTAFA